MAQPTTTRSALPDGMPLAKVSMSPSDSSTSRPGAPVTRGSTFFLATSSMPSDLSTANTAPRPSSLRTISAVRWPVPQASSTTVSPGRTGTSSRAAME